MRGLSFTLAAALGVATTLPFHSVPLFNLTSHLGPVSGPITVEGGEQIGEFLLVIGWLIFEAFPIVSGTIIGPSMAGVITGGLTVSTVYSNGSYFSSDTTYYGSLGNTTFTAQGSAIHHSENGSPGQEVQRLVSHRAISSWVDDVCRLSRSVHRTKTSQHFTSSERRDSTTGPCTKPRIIRLLGPRSAREDRVEAVSDKGRPPSCNRES